MPPTIGGKNCPYDKGQSGTARLDPVLVTSPPTKISTKVAPAVKSAKRCRQRKKPCGEPDADTFPNGETVSGRRVLTTMDLESFAKPAGRGESPGELPSAPRVFNASLTRLRGIVTNEEGECECPRVMSIPRQLP